MTVCCSDFPLRCLQIENCDDPVVRDQMKQQLAQQVAKTYATQVRTLIHVHTHASTHRHRKTHANTRPMYHNARLNVLILLAYAD